MRTTTFIPVGYQLALPFVNDAVEATRAIAMDQLHHTTAVYTAEVVVDESRSRLAWPSGARRLVDLGCGDGVFLGRELLKVIGSGDPGDDAIVGRIEGWEIHPFACAQARARIAGILSAAGRPAALANHMARRMVKNADFLIDGPTAPTTTRTAVVASISVKRSVFENKPPLTRWLRTFSSVPWT